MTTASRLLSLGLGIALFGLATQSHSYALTGIYDFRHLVTNDSTLTPLQRQYPALVYEFEGLAFIGNDLWASIAADPAGASRQFWKLDLENRTVSSSIPDPLSFSNPVGLASNGNQLIVGENFHGAGNSIWAFTPGGSTSAGFFLTVGTCNEVEGLAYSGGKIYASCQNDHKILEIDPATGAVSRTFPFAMQLLGLAETNVGWLIVGTYPNREIVVFHPDGVHPTLRISLADLFLGTGSAYYELTHEVYRVQVVPSEGFRTMPDPDGLAFRNGKIYMSFDGDLRIFEITLNGCEPGALLPEHVLCVAQDNASIPAPGTLALLALGLTGLGISRHRNFAMPFAPGASPSASP